MATDFTYLTDIPVFHSLTEKETKDLLSHAARQTFPAGYMLQFEGQPSRVFAVMTHGMAKAVLLREDGREIMLHYYRSGDFFGESDLTQGELCSHSILTVQESGFVLVSLDAIKNLVKSNGAFAYDLLSFVNERLQRTQHRLRDFVYLRGEGKILKYFQDLADQVGTEAPDGRLIPERLSHQVIGDTCGFARETVTRLLRQLQQERVLWQTPDGWMIATPHSTDEVS